MRKILLGGLVVAVFFGGTLWVLDTFFGDLTPARRPALAEPPPLQVSSRSPEAASVALFTVTCTGASASWARPALVGGRPFELLDDCGAMLKGRVRLLSRPR